jgi:hypothetical protein
MTAPPAPTADEPGDGKWSGRFQWSESEWQELQPLNENRWSNQQRLTHRLPRHGPFDVKEPRQSAATPSLEPR